MPTNNGNMIFSQYNLRNTLSGSCSGYINGLTVSGGTSPYSVAWSGSVNSYTADTFGIYNLCEGDYTGTITDITGGTGSTTFTISGLVKPIISVNLSDNSCVTDTNKKCSIAVTTATTLGENFRYELRKSDKVIKVHYGTSADTTHTFSDLDNGVYSVTMVENRPTVDNVEFSSGCTEFDYNSGLTYSGWSMTEIFDKWGAFVPYASYTLWFLAGWGPNWAATSTVPLGLFQDGVIYSDDPKVWLYTGDTANRLTDSGTDWYLGTYNIEMEEGNPYGPTVGTANADIGKFYYNTYINKFIIRYPTTTAAPLVKWLTVDPRDNYGRYGNPRASMCTGSTYGIRNVDVDSNDRTVDEDGNIALASNVLAGSLRKLQSNTNNSQSTGMVSACPSDNYEWEVTVNSTNVDDDTVALLLHSFRDTLGLYGPIGVRHNLSLRMNVSSGQVSIANNNNNSAYGFNRYTSPNFRECNGGCTSSTYSAASDYGQTILLSNSGATSPVSTSSTWSGLQGLRIKITRANTRFKIQFTDPLNGSIGDPRPYNPVYDINFDLNSSSTWSGNTTSAPEWVDDNSLLKYKSPGRIGIWQSSQPQSNWYHMTFSSNLAGPSTTTSVLATSAATTNIMTTNKCRPTSNTRCNKGVPIIKPKVSVTLQNTPHPSTTVPGLVKPSVTPTTTIGDVPALPVYNASTNTSREMSFYFGGNTDDLIFGNSYPKYRIYPYIFETEEVATLPDYEFMFDTLPCEIDSATGGFVCTGTTEIPFSALSTEDAWEFIIRPSYLTKDKKAETELWFDTATYPPSKQIDYDTDLYMAVLTNPPVPTLYLDNFNLPVEITKMATETATVSGMQDTDDSNPALPAYSAQNYYHYIPASVGSNPLVVVNGVVLKQGRSGTTGQNQTRYGDPLNPDQGDYMYNRTTGTVTFFKETVKNGDELQFIFDIKGGSNIQSFEIPATVTTTTTDTIFEENGYYYINLDMQCVGGIKVAVNGLMLFEDSGNGSNFKDYRKTSETRIQLLGSTDTYKTGDIITLWYRTIYTVIGVTAVKTPSIPIFYYKDKTTVDEIIVRLFDSNGSIVKEYKITIDVKMVGNINKTVTLEPPTFGTYSYDVIIRRYYPVLNAKTIQTESQTKRVTFEISRNAFYSPQRPY
jgi:hypothetical protein